MNISSPRAKARPSRIAAATAGFFAVAFLHTLVAQPIVVSQSPVSATDLSPGDTLLIGDIPTSRVTFHWRSLGAQRSPELRPVNATSFRLCFYVSGAQHDCLAGTGTVAVVAAGGAGFSSTEVTSVSWWDRMTNRRTPTMDYQYAAALPQTVLDRNLEWLVVSCTHSQKQRCSQSRPRHLTLTARDLAVADINADSSGRNGVQPKIKVRNDGRATGGSFTVETRAWEVLPDGSNPRSLKNIGDSNVQGSDIVITRQGELISVADYRSRGLSTLEIIGFHRPGFAQASWTRRNLNEPVPVAAGTPLRPGTCTAGEDCSAQTAEFRACDDTVTDCSIQATTQTRPVAFVVFARVTSQPFDFELADNALAKGNMGLR